MRKLLLFLAFTATAFGQSGILPSGTFIDWTQVGIPGGIVAGTQCGSTITSTGSDQSAAINSALSSCGGTAGAPKFVNLAAGTFVIHSNVTIPSYTRLVGQGANQTILNCTQTGGSGCTILGSALNVAPTTANDTAVTGGLTAASTSITVASAAHISIGSLLNISELNDATEGVTASGDEGFCNFCQYSGTRTTGQTVLVTGVSGTTITIAAPGLYRAYGATLPNWAATTKYWAANHITNGGHTYRQTATPASPYSCTSGGTTPAFSTSGGSVSDGTCTWLDIGTGTTTAPLATPYTPTVDAGIQNLQIFITNAGTTTLVGPNTIMNQCQYCFVQGVGDNYTDADPVLVSYSYGGEIVDSYFSNAILHTPGTYDSAVQLGEWTSQTLVQNNIFERLHESIIIETGASGNVVSYNFMQAGFDGSSPSFVIGGIDFHTAHPMFNLLEGNVLELIHMDSVWGSSKNNTAFRDWTNGSMAVDNPIASGRATVTGGSTVTCGSLTTNTTCFSFQASRAMQINYTSTGANLVGNVVGSAAQTGNIGYGSGTTTYNSGSGQTDALFWPITQVYDTTLYDYAFGFANSSDTGSFPNDSTAAASTAFLHGNYGLISNSIVWSGSVTHTLPASFYLASKPGWFGSLPFPSIGPDVTGASGPGGHVALTAGNPAQNCYFATMGGSAGGAGSPLSFNAASCYASAVVVATPTASVGTGTYVGSQNPVYTTTTTGATLCYTTDGSTPTATTPGTCSHGTTLTNGTGFAIFNTGTVVNILGTLSGDTNSAVATFTYTLTPTTWYVLATGGTRTQCTGTTNAAYPGSGTGQACAFNDFRWLYDNQTYQNWQANGSSWVIASGDTVIATSAAAIAAVPGLIAASAGPYNRIGWDYGGSCSGAGCGAGYTWCYGQGQCGIPPPPAGTPANPTHILGANHGSCSTTVNLPGSFVSTTVPNNASVFEVYGDFGLNTAFDLSGTHDVDIQCLGITTHGTCAVHVSPNSNPCSSSVPLSNYASEGIRSSPATGNNITLTDVWVHGFQDSGWYGPIDGTVTMNDVRFSYNGLTGFNMDDGTDPQAGGTVTTNYKTTDFNGCWQSWPFTTTVPIGGCSDQNSGGDGDGTATPSSSSDTFVNNHTTAAYNTQDGDDVGHNQAPGSVSWQNSVMYGNMGGTFKSGGEAATLINSVSIQNCYRMAAAITGTPSGYNSQLSLFCRAGDGVTVNWLGGGSSEVIKVQNNAIVTYGNDAIDFQIQGTGSCTGCTMLTEGNVFLAYNNPSTGLPHNPVMYGNMSPTTTDHNTIFNFFGYTCAGTDQCVDPLFVGEPPPATNLTNSGLDGFNFNLSSTSPAKSALTPISGITTDFYGVTRLNPTSAGAAQYVPVVPTSVTFGATATLGQTVTP